MNASKSSKLLKQLLVFAMIFSFYTMQTGASDKIDDFEMLYQDWLNSTEKVKFSSNSSDYVELKEFQLIIDKGISVVPQLIAKIEGKVSLEAKCLKIAIQKILKMKLALPENENFAETDRELVLDWWKQGRFKTKERFIILEQKWQQQKPSEKMKRPFTFDWNKEYGNDVHAWQAANRLWKEMPEGPKKERMRPYNRTVYQRLLDLGIPALPYVVEEIKKGDKDLLEAVNLWTDSSLQEYASQKNKNLQSLSEDDLKGVVTQWWEENQEKYKLPE